jgi:hypothetical protein
VPFVLACSGCYSWQDVDLSRLSGDERPDRARVVLEDGTGHVLFEPRIIAADSVFGYAEAADSAAAAWPLGDIARVQVRAVNPVVTGGVIIGAMTVGFILACSSTGCSPF